MKSILSIIIALLVFKNMALAQTDKKKKTDKIAVYQVFTRLFGNQNTTNTFNGTREQNGVGKFNDINKNALNSIRKLGITHIWYTGVIEHATMTDFSAYGILKDHPQVVKGIAGSPYAIKDYYDVNPDLAIDVSKRMEEFEALLERSHQAGLEVIIDFVPNHVARQYASDKKPAGVKDFGETDDKNVVFSNQNNFYYIPGQAFAVPEEVNPPVKFDKKYEEFPAKATGNDVFSARPTINDWFETVKLNYGIDYLSNRKKNFDPVPDTWNKMKDILSFWAEKGVNGFRCDMAEMVPVEFWGWVIPQVKKINPDIIFIAEIYNPDLYASYIRQGHFDYLYDKVGLYDALRRLIEGHGNAEDITRVWQKESGEFSSHMLRFLENHDEQRIASKYFGKRPESAFTSMMLSATLHTGPVMVYSGQELGVNPVKAEGFQGEDGRTTIFDYWGITEMQSWINEGKFSEKTLSPHQKEIRDFYKKILTFATENEAVSHGHFHDLQYLNHHGKSENYDQTRIYSYLRHTDHQTLLFIYNFDLNNTISTHVKLPAGVLKTQFGEAKNIQLKNVFDKKDQRKVNISEVTDLTGKDLGIEVTLKPDSFLIFEIK
ncbi:alpha-amylase [Emticicia sp. CRIBPO]|uniref:alpha-amylase family protein n=1 Tax=Emticicia sp. CRIBPO TaxID=2683258 RepID=UPI0014136096|nr:alpha-amylase family protein [Emticicia sp. CRIBPO]NBA84353.1 alpha-amylase [Emticicia sp. CRIBPO]